MSTVLATATLTAGDQEILQRLRSLILDDPKKSFTTAELAGKSGLDAAATLRYLDYLTDLEREYEPAPKFKGVAKVFIRGETFYETLSDNADVRRDYDYRATNEGGRDFCPKNMFYYLWAWINMVEEKCARQGTPNNRTILLTNDCRYYPPEIITAARKAAIARGYKVVFALAAGNNPSCVSSYSHAVRMARPVMAIFITASHVSRPAENTVVGAKVSILGSTGRLESLSTREIKITTAQEIQKLKQSADLSGLAQSGATQEEIDVTDSHTRMAVAGVLAALGHFPGLTLHDLAQQLKTAPDLDAALVKILPAEIPVPFKGLNIVIEGAYTTSGPLADLAFKALGTQTTLLHGNVIAVKGPHKADPSITQNLADLFAEMTKQKAHLGLAFDLDGDRGAIVFPTHDGSFAVLAPDKLGQVLIPFLMNKGGYQKAEKPMYVRDCLSTDALIDQGRASGVTIETTDAGYVFLKKRENEKAREGFLTLGMGEASGHAWLDFTGPFENPILVALLFTAMSIERIAKKGYANGGATPPEAMEKVFNDLAIPYRKSARFQPLFAPELIAEVAQGPVNDTGWTPQSGAPIPQKLITQCRSASVKKLMNFFTPGKIFATPLGELKVEKFESEWDESEEIHRFGKIYFSINGEAAGSFVSRGSSNDPTAVQVWEVKEFAGAIWSGVKLREAIILQRFDLIGGLVLAACEDLKILELVDRKPAANMAGVLPSVQRYRELCSSGAQQQ